MTCDTLVVIYDRIVTHACHVINIERNAVSLCRAAHAAAADDVPKVDCELREYRVSSSPDGRRMAVFQRRRKYRKKETDYCAHLDCLIIIIMIKARKMML